MSSFSSIQQTALANAFVDIHRRMADLEAVMNGAAHAPPFSDYVDDLEPEQRKALGRAFQEVRRAMQSIADDHNIPLNIRPRSLRWVVLTGLGMLGVAVDDLGPDRLKGYGELTESARREILEVQRQLGELVERIGDGLRRGAPDAETGN